MRFAALPVLLLAILVHANPTAVDDSTAIAGPNSVGDVAKCNKLFAAVPNPHIIARATKKKKKKKGSSGGIDSAAVGFVSPSRALQIGALGVGVMEIVRLWG